MTEIRHAVRRLRRRPGRAAALSLTFAIGVGATTAAWAAVEGMLLRDLPVERQDELVVAWYLNPERAQLRIPLVARAWAAIRDGAPRLEGVAAFSAWGATPAVVAAAEPYALARVPVAGDFFGVLGARPAAGRLLGPADDAVGAEPTAVLSYAAWTTRYGADPSVVGTTLTIADAPTTVVGVAPAGFDYPRGVEVWTTLREDYAGWPEGRISPELHLLARVPAGMTHAEVAEAMTSAVRDEPSGRLASYASYSPVVRGLEEEVVGTVRPVLRVAMAAAVLLLLAAVANATLFLLAGGGAAVREAAVRRALGAPAGRVASAPVADAAVAGLLGTALGIGLAGLAVGGLVPIAPPELPRTEGVALGVASVLFGALVGASAALTAGAIAGVVIARGGARAALSAPRTASPGSGRLGPAIAALQVGLTVVSAVCAGLLVRTVVEIERLEPGFAVDDVSVVELRVPYDWFDVPERYLDALEAVVEDLESRAGVRAARPSVGPPLTQRIEVVVRAQGQSDDQVEGNPYVAIDVVQAGHFEALAIPLLAGRGITAADDRPGADPVVVVDEVLARALWPGEDPVGKLVDGLGHPDTWFRVVGVAAATRYRALLESHPRAYYPVRRIGVAPPITLLVRTSGLDPAIVESLARDAFGRADPAVRVLGAGRMTDVLAAPAAGRRFAAGVLVSFAVATLLLALVGVYGVFTVAVLERTREMGVRKALGARRVGLVALVLRSAARVATVGAMAGLLAAAWAGRLVESILFGVAPTDPWTLASVGVASLVLALLACLAPALRASATDPAVSLRGE